MLFLPTLQTKDQESEETAFGHEEAISESFYQTIDAIVQDYLREKHLDFSLCRFVPQAQEIYNERILKNIHSEAELRDHYDGMLARLEEQNDKQIAETVSEHRKEYNKLVRTLEKETERKTTSEAKAQRLNKKLEQQKAEIESIVKRLGTTRTRPTKPSGVCEWAEQNFAPRIVIHNRAQRMMKDIQNDEFDLNLLCDSLEYLANEYWESMNGTIDEEERLRRSSLYYNRPFEVVGNSDSSIRDYPDAYTVSYSKNGRETDCRLALHLSVGKDPMRLLRVYFFYDKEDRKIVVGSMPKHLPISSY